MYATTKQIRKIARNVCNMHNVQINGSYTDKPRNSNNSKKRYVALILYCNNNLEHQVYMDFVAELHKQGIQNTHSFLDEGSFAKIRFIADI